MLTRTQVAGADALCLTGQAARATVVPGFGGKIASLVDPRSDREWLWHNDRLPFREPVYDASYTGEFDSGGWDECFPAVAPGFFPSGPWKGIPIPDHGELWGLPWEVEEATDARIALAASGIRFPLRFTRTIALADSGLRLDYRVSNPTPFDFPFLWCAHPLLAIEPGMELLLPEGTELQAYGRDLGKPWRWPRELPPPDAGLAIKAFGRSPRPGWAAVRAGSSGLRMEWDPAVVTHLGIWLNAGGWAGSTGAAPYYNLGLEPGIGPGDDLNLAASILQDAGTIPAKGHCDWTLQLHLTP